MSAAAVFPVAIRTPKGLAFEGSVGSVRAEDDDGWFGILPRRAPLLASLPAGLVTMGRSADERFVAHSGGLLHWDGQRCRMMLEEAEISANLTTIADQLAQAYASREARASHQRGVLLDLEREALRRLVNEVAA